MAAITNFVILMHQQKHINSEQDLDKFDKSVKALKYTTIVDIALGLICSLGAILLGPLTSPLAIGLGIAGAVLFISGASMLKAGKIDDLSCAVHFAWRARVQAEQTLKDLVAEGHAQKERHAKELQLQEQRHREESIANDKAREELGRRMHEEHTKQMALLNKEKQRLDKVHQELEMAYATLD
jgi:hypothetical protein